MQEISDEWKKKCFDSLDRLSKKMDVDVFMAQTHLQTYYGLGFFESMKVVVEWVDNNKK